MAGQKGLEPSTSAVTGRRSNQLSYYPKIFPEPSHNTQKDKGRARFFFSFFIIEASFFAFSKKIPLMGTLFLVNGKSSRYHKRAFFYPSLNENMAVDKNYIFYPPDRSICSGGITRKCPK